LSPFVVGGLVFVAYGFFVLWRLRLMGYDPSYFVIAGPPLTDPTQTLPNLHVYPPNVTYDGQFFYRLALEPWTRAQSAFGVTFDLPAYRQQRILYPLLAWVLSAGQWRLTPAVLIAVNLLAVTILGAAAAAFATHQGRNAFAALAIPFYPGYVVTIERDLSELTEAALLVVGMLCIERRRYRLAAAALSVGVLARETLLVVPLVGLGAWAWLRWRRQSTGDGPPPSVWLIPIVVYVAWSAVMLLNWGATAAGMGADNFAVPLEGLSRYLGTLGLGTAAWKAHWVEYGLLILICGVPLSLAAVLWRTRGTSGATLVLSAACGVYALLMLVYGVYIWQDAYAYVRVLHELFLTGVLAMLVVSRWLPRLFGLGAVLVWLAFALQTGPSP
jgi:hypothetical protein